MELAPSRTPDRPRRIRGRRRLHVWLLVGLVVASGIGVGRTLLAGPKQYPWPPEPCVVHGAHARCGTLVVPEDRTKPNGHKIGLHVVILPAFSKPARQD